MNSVDFFQQLQDNLPDNHAIAAIFDGVEWTIQIEAKPEQGSSQALANQFNGNGKLFISGRGRTIQLAARDLGTRMAQAVQGFTPLFGQFRELTAA